ncbi:Rossmann-fold NAD(P)-binding domain-containing protein [Sphingomonas psychrotolerans]|uniref:NAD(P)-dependent oxidoreductase n=1 Tax=Sphingomonas psychrotolerans TaxID=1327635 RepID=A0A2K8MH98_9SPHN|nr:NAD(P)-dependent oxidoreductase [Sphingomonas psychrotolerans]ATY33257.1 NAD(P)-dependent oxidoreductase [Sphingomonas psychrotolerans]
MRLLIFGLGYTGSALARHLAPGGWRIAAVTRDGRDGSIAFADRERAAFEIDHATHIVSTVAPDAADPILAAFGPELARARGWLGYLSSTGVYGDTRGAWVDETATTGGGRRTARTEADAAWLALGARVFRLPGIYGPGRSPLDRAARGDAARIHVPGQVFSRIHLDDLVAGIVTGFDAPRGAWNLADDLPAPQSDVVAYACRLLGIPPPPLIALGEARLSPQARAFYSENRRVANGKAKRLLGWRPRFPDYRLGLRALSASTSPIITSAAPATASSDQR